MTQTQEEEELLRKKIAEIISHARANVIFTMNTPAADKNIEFETGEIWKLIEQYRNTYAKAYAKKVVIGYEKLLLEVPSPLCPECWHVLNERHRLLSTLAVQEDKQ